MSSGFKSYYPGDSLFHKLDPRVKVIMLLCITLIIFILDDPIVITGVLLAMIAIWFYVRLPKELIAMFLRFIWAMFFIIIVLEGLTFPGRPLIIIPTYISYLPYITMSFEGVVLSTAMSLRVLAILFIAPLIIYTTPLDRLVLGMVKLKIPYVVSFIITTALNLIPSINNTIFAIQEAQRSRGHTLLEKGSFIDKIKSYIPILVPLVVYAMRNAQQLTVAMSARAFGVSGDRTYYFELKFAARDYIVLGITITITAIIFGLHFLYGFGSLASASWFVG